MKKRFLIIWLLLSLNLFSYDMTNENIIKEAKSLGITIVDKDITIGKPVQNKISKEDAIKALSGEKLNLSKLEIGNYAYVLLQSINMDISDAISITFKGKTYNYVPMTIKRISYLYDTYNIDLLFKANIAFGDTEINEFYISLEKEITEKNLKLSPWISKWMKLPRENNYFTQKTAVAIELWKISLDNMLNLKDFYDQSWANKSNYINSIDKNNFSNSTDTYFKNNFNKLTEVQRIKLINYMKNWTQIDEIKEYREIVSWSINSYCASKDLSDYLQDKGWYVDYSSTLEESKNLSNSMYALIQKDIKPLQDGATNLKNQKEVEKQKLITDLVYEYNKWKKLDEEWKKLDEEWKKLDEEWKKLDEEWKKLDEEWKKLDEEWKKLDVEIWEILAQIMSK